MLDRSTIGAVALAAALLTTLSGAWAIDEAKYPDFKGNVKAVDTRDLWREAADSPANQGYHYNHNAETYMETGLRLGLAMAELLENTK